MSKPTRFNHGKFNAVLLIWSVVLRAERALSVRVAGEEYLEGSVGASGGGNGFSPPKRRHYYIPYGLSSPSSLSLRKKPPQSPENPTIPWKFRDKCLSRCLSTPSWTISKYHKWNSQISPNTSACRCRQPLTFPHLIFSRGIHTSINRTLASSIEILISPLSPKTCEHPENTQTMLYFSWADVCRRLTPLLGPSVLFVHIRRWTRRFLELYLLLHNGLWKCMRISPRLLGVSCPESWARWAFQLLLTPAENLRFGTLAGLGEFGRFLASFDDDALVVSAADRSAVRWSDNASMFFVGMVWFHRANVGGLNEFSIGDRIIRFETFLAINDA